jgi:hypothetical protein
MAGSALGASGSWGPVVAHVNTIINIKAKGLDDGQTVFRFPAETFFKTSRRSLGPTGVPGTLCSGVERPEPQANHSPPYSTKVKNEWSYTPPPSTYLHSVDRDLFTF